jgi:hypothetical protein
VVAIGYAWQYPAWLPFATDRQTWLHRAYPPFTAVARRYFSSGDHLFLPLFIFSPKVRASVTVSQFHH